MFKLFVKILVSLLIEIEFACTVLALDNRACLVPYVLREDRVSRFDLALLGRVRGRARQWKIWVVVGG